MENTPVKSSITGRLSGLGGIIVGVLGFLTAVLTNLDNIKQTTGKLLGSTASKLTLLQPRLDLSALPVGFTLPTSDIPGISLQSEKPDKEELYEGHFVIDIDQARDGDRLQHSKFAELKDPTGFIQQFVTQQIVNPDRHGFVVIDSNRASSVISATIRVAIKKETNPVVKNCKIKVNNPNGDIVSTFNSIDLGKGVWTNYFEFGLIFDRIPTTKTKSGTKWDAVLTCDPNGVVAGDGPVALVLAP